MTTNGEHFEVYKGWIINPGITMPAQGIYDFNVYLTRDDLREDEPRHIASSLEDARRWIDEQERTLEEKEALPMMEAIEKLPFMPAKGPPLPEYVGREITPEFVSSIMRSPSSDYGRTLVDKVALDMNLFLRAGGFEIVDKLEETGWSSDDLAYNGTIKHLSTGTQWDIEVWVNFEWKQPEKVEGVPYLDFLPAGVRVAADRWEIMPEEEWSKHSFDLTAAEGIEASKIITEYVSRR